VKFMKHFKAGAQAVKVWEPLIYTRTLKLKVFKMAVFDGCIVVLNFAPSCTSRLYRVIISN
jgi:hypothetical protein